MNDLPYPPLPEQPVELPQPEQLHPKSKYVRMFLLPALGMLVFAVAGVSFGISYYLTVPKSSIVVENQPFRSIMRIKKATLINGGIVVIKTASRVLQVVAKTDYLLPDTYVNIPLDADMKREAKPNTGDTVFAAIYDDVNGNQLIDEADKVASNIFGQPVSVPFKITIF